MNIESWKVFLLRPIASFYSRKISDYLLRPKVHSLDRVIRSTKCGIKRCQVCMNVSELNKFTSNVTCEIDKINRLYNNDANF